MTTLSLDAREILSYLNELGFRNITAEQLKEFMQDLRKLIKYEERLCVFNQENQKNRIFDSSDNLHKAFTISFKARTSKEQKPTKELCKKAAATVNDKIENKKKILNEKNTNNKQQKDGQSNNKIDGEKYDLKLKQTTSKERHSEKSASNNGDRMWIRPKSIKKSQGFKKNKDPVELYQYYKREWEKFKQYFPGENDHSELRWKIRHKLLGVS